MHETLENIALKKYIAKRKIIWYYSAREGDKMKEELKNIIEKLENNNQKEIINLMTKVYSDEENEKIAKQIERINLEKVMELYENASNIPCLKKCTLFLSYPK